MSAQKHPPDSLTEEEGVDELSMLFSVGAGILAKSGDLNSFLDWIADAGPVLAPGLATGIDPRTGPLSDAFRALGLGLYQATPLPEANFRRVKLPTPGRNEPCYCGSGRKYKQCCIALEGGPDFANINMLPFVLDALPNKVLTELPDTDVDIDMVEDTASQWRVAGDTKRAVALLEPWFGKQRKLTGKLDYLFDLLMDCYFELGNVRKRRRLLDDVGKRGDNYLRVTALQRKASIQADQGNNEAAWQTFQEAQRLDPDHPGLSALEVTLLVTRGEMAQAANRARFWAARLERNRHADYRQLIDFLRAVATDPAQALAAMTRDMNPAVDTLVQLLEAAPAVTSHYRVEGDEEGGCLVPDRKIAAAEATWSGMFPQIKPALTATQHGDESVWQSAPHWLPVLESSPYAWHSFDILDDLVMAVDALQLLGSESALLLPLLRRAHDLLAINLADANAGITTLPWLFMENRPALRLLAYQAFRHLDSLESGGDPAGNLAFIQLGEQLLALNPMDNHGLRPYLARAYIACGEPAKAVALSDRFPNDFCGMTLNRILALYRLGRLEEAGQCLQEAANHHAVAIDMLLAGNPKKPRMDGVGIRLGGKDEAWLYREEHRALWTQDDALAWLRTAWKAVAPKKGKKRL